MNRPRRHLCLSFVAVSILAIAVCLPCHAHAQTEHLCNGYRYPHITVTPLFTQEAYDDSQPLEQLRAMANQPNIEAAGMREVPIGLTASSVRLESAFKIASQALPSGDGVCATVTQLDLRFGFEGTTVYIANEIPRGSCGYQEVVAHEQHHIAIDRNIVATYLPQLQTLIANELQRLGTIHASSAAEAEVFFHSSINDYLRQIGSDVAHVREEQQRAFDNVEEYKRLSMSCNGELSSIIKRVSQSY